MPRRKRDDSESLELLEDQEYGEMQGRLNSFQKTGRSISSLPFMTIGILLFFILDIIAFIYIGNLLLDAKRSISNVDNLDFRNPYVGLDELYRDPRINSSHYDAVINEPRFSAQISPGQRANEVFPIDSRRWLSDFGLLSPPDRHFQVSSKDQIVTVVQFNILDYGMENCSLKIRLPHRGDDLPRAYSLPSVWDEVALDVCELDVQRPLREWSMSWATRPKCFRTLGTVKARIGGEVEIEQSFCKSGSFIGYQISCAESSTM